MEGPMSYEKLKYEVVKKDDVFEIRKYDPYVLMKVSKDSNQGFGILFNYISGNNSKNQKIQMTIPVVTDVTSSSYIAFTMPSEFVGNYPNPLDPNIQMIHVPSKEYLVIQFKGSIRHATKAYEALKTYALENQIELIHEPILLRYQGPFTLPFLKDNDVIVEIKQS
jgi:effector-binding domain-containing protein